MCSSQVIEGQTGNNGQHECACSEQVVFGAGRELRRVLPLIERGSVGIPAESAKGDGLSACCSGGFTGADVSGLDVSLIDSDAEQFTAVDRSSVVAARSCCDPAVDLAAGHEKGQDVFDLERIHHMPAERHGFERVHDGDTLIADDKLWSDENEPNRNAEGRAPKPAAQILPIASNQGDAQQENKCCQSNAAPRPINLRVSHASIFAGDN